MQYVITRMTDTGQEWIDDMHCRTKKSIEARRFDDEEHARLYLACLIRRLGWRVEQVID